MDNICFIDTETTGNNPTLHSIHEIAMVPVIERKIRLDWAVSYYVDSDNYLCGHDYLKVFPNPISTRDKKQPVMQNHNLGAFIKNRLNDWFPGAILNLGGQNLGSFDMQLIFRYAPELREYRRIRYNYLDIGNQYLVKGDLMIPSLKVSRQRAIDKGANLRFDNTHRAFDDAALSAEFYCFKMFGEIQYVEVSGSYDSKQPQEVS